MAGANIEVDFASGVAAGEVNFGNQTFDGSGGSGGDQGTESAAFSGGGGGGGGGGCSAGAPPIGATWVAMLALLAVGFRVRR
jgi:uncharacterized protein (TIGR03382 family)